MHTRLRALVERQSPPPSIASFTNVTLFYLLRVLSGFKAANKEEGKTHQYTRGRAHTHARPAAPDEEVATTALADTALRADTMMARVDAHED